jgi:hypothetical protein
MTDPTESADSLVAKAIESVLEAVPAGDAEEPPEGIAKYQPWADTAAAPGRNKRPLQSLLDELAERVAAEPEARAAMPSAKPPAVAFFDRFGSRRGAAEGEPAPGGGRGRRGRTGRRRGSGAGGTGGGAPQGGVQGEPKPPQQPGGGRRSRGAAKGGGLVPGAQPPVAQGDAAAAGRKRRRRRGGRGRSSGGGPAGGGGGGGPAT